MQLSCFIIDDEPLALGLIESYVAKTPFLKLTGKFHSAIEATQAVQQLSPDLIFLDIQMAELNGMEFAKLVPEQSRIIFTTAFQQYALESYKVNALDYLLKPFGYADFLQAANKALQWFEINNKANFEKQSEGKNGSIFVKSDYKLLQINTKDIAYIEGLKDYVKIYLDDNPKAIISHTTMKTVEEMLSKQNFMRVHRSYIVNTDKIKEIEHNRIVFGKVRIPISDSYKDAFQEFLNKKMIN
ncbi:DNA-binding response regulator [Paludibacter sp. 221]|uniref:LytR/AlgR family response regulator transcription factor n=1 Tax=Paludibacter sp. 221 TaxID=2302939 RepID=UPI0013D1460B|nr:LytTR family DNA-binding domain-containing protein [Paludibacter sp. 221]NDV46651.1 DNA-binding response regulator [Paludibacter sp. 221]